MLKIFHIFRPSVAQHTSLPFKKKLPATATHPLPLSPVKTHSCIKAEYDYTTDLRGAGARR